MLGQVLLLLLHAGNEWLRGQNQADKYTMGIMKEQHQITEWLFKQNSDYTDLWYIMP